MGQIENEVEDRTVYPVELMTYSALLVLLAAAAAAVLWVALDEEVLLLVPAAAAAAAVVLVAQEVVNIGTLGVFLSIMMLNFVVAALVVAQVEFIVNLEMVSVALTLPSLCVLSLVMEKRWDDLQILTTTMVKVAQRQFRIYIVQIIIVVPEVMVA